jgi:hypothetical protein
MQVVKTNKLKNDKAGINSGCSYKILGIRHAESLWNQFSLQMKNAGKKDVKEIERSEFEPLALTKDP